MRIIADKNIPFVRQAFDAHGELQLLESNAINPTALKRATALLVRSETTVDAALLREAPQLRLVCAATTGYDHIDLEWLKRREIEFAYAPGCNARSVAEYVLAALLQLRRRYNYELEGRRIGIVGVGAIGSQVASLARALSMVVVQNDPPRAEAEGGSGFASLEETLQTDIVTVHVPLTDQSPHPTRQLFDQERFAAMRPGMVFINISRGEVVETAALKKAIASNRVRHAVVDVWESEPHIDWTLVEKATIATPHIAGYSLDGRVKATQAIYRAFCDKFDIHPEWQGGEAPAEESLQLPYETADNSQAVLSHLIKEFYDIEKDDRAMRQASEQPFESRSEIFRGLRKNYRIRREFHTRECLVKSRSLRDYLGHFGFRPVSQ